MFFDIFLVVLRGCYHGLWGAKTEEVNPGLAFPGES